MSIHLSDFVSAHISIFGSTDIYNYPLAYLTIQLSLHEVTTLWLHAFRLSAFVLSFLPYRQLH